MPQPQVVQPPGLEHRRRHAAGAQPVVVQRPVHAGGGLAVADQMHDVAVVAVAEAGVEPAALPQPGVEQLVPADDGIDAAAGEQVAEQFQRRPHAGGLHIHVAAGQRAAVFVNAVGGAGGHAAAARLQRGQQHGVKVRLHQIVGVHKADVVPGGGVQPGVAGAGRAAVRLVDDPHPAVLRGQPVAQFAAAVGAAVLHQQQLQVVVGLGQHAAHRQRQQVFGVVHRHDNADLFFCSRHGGPPGVGLDSCLYYSRCRPPCPIRPPKQNRRARSPAVFVHFVTLFFPPPASAWRSGRPAPSRPRRRTPPTTWWRCPPRPAPGTPP